MACCKSSCQQAVNHNPLLGTLGYSHEEEAEEGFAIDHVVQEERKSDQETGYVGLYCCSVGPSAEDQP
jgi:hypothetical protein